jgi:TetR/AcrR family transcriptional regulator, transcriptional repressor for nem operon
VGRTSDARQRLIDAALELFGKRAYSSVGVAEISARAGVQKGSFYHFFASKEALALAVIDQHWDEQQAQWSGIFAQGQTVLDRLRMLFRATADRQVAARAGTGSVTGCMFGNLALEVSTQVGPIRERLQAIFDEQIAMIAAQLDEAVGSGELQLENVPHAARAIVAQLEGLVLFAKLFNDPTELDSLWTNSLRLLGAPTPRPSTIDVA